jgi:hypothetical protein
MSPPPDNERKMMRNVMDIIERFQTHHALKEESEMKKNSHAPGNDAAAPSMPDKNSIFETDGVRVSMVAVPGNTEWSPPRDGRDRLVVPLGKIDQVLARNDDPSFPARGTWIPANSSFKVPNKANQTRTLLIVEFSDVGREALTE